MTGRLIVLFVVGGWAASAGAQPTTPPVADPAYAYLVEGRVLDAAGRPAAGVVVERARGPRDPRPYSRGAYRTTTDRRGRFRLEFRGLGWPTPRTWHLAIRRPRCAPVIRTVVLREGRHRGAPADVARRVVLRAGPCRPPAPATTPGRRSSR